MSHCNPQFDKHELSVAMNEKSPLRKNTMYIFRTNQSAKTLEKYEHTCIKQIVGRGCCNNYSVMCVVPFLSYYPYSLMFHAYI